MAQADEVPERGPDQEQPSAERSSAQTAQAAPAVEVAADVAPDGSPEALVADPHDARASAGIGAHPAAVAATMPVVRLLDENGARQHDERFSRWVEDVDAEALQRMHRSMVRARRLDEMSTALQRQGEMALWPPLRGQEAAQVGSALAQGEHDYVFPSYREHAVVLERGVPAERVLVQFRGHAASGWKPSETRTHVYSLVLASQVPHAVGYAMGMVQDRRLAEEAGEPAPEPGAVTVYFGDGASTEGEIHESMVFAASYDAPVVFFVQNNQWAISVPFSTQSRVPLAARAAGYGFEGVRVDGNDPLAVLAVTRWATAEAREGRGPVLIEAETFRLGAHTTADDPTKYRLSAEEAQWAQKEPLLRMRALLETELGVQEQWFQDLEEETDQWLTEVRSELLRSDPGELDQRFDVVYAQSHPLVEEERAWHRDYADSFLDGEGGPGADAGQSQEGQRP
ncbi:pyruvate dehydrogenase (acetyl-transferring) E1 component subunit alpha [Kocuria palustris]|uniref:thiamine pyrophosphate-dependent enzyme n=1 Tax=Kocuria palustris TaxID=71999 RepID=UPI001EF85A8E|nr:thiamine pyrophosphate-dependent enzyme [Kocuria palustris]MBM7822725.1 pyruvate dehydrogenase E1 component alpha subunit [Kocuria palustris]